MYPDSLNSVNRVSFKKKAEECFSDSVCADCCFIACLFLALPNMYHMLMTRYSIFVLKVALNTI